MITDLSVCKGFYGGNMSNCDTFLDFPSLFQRHFVSILMVRYYPIKKFFVKKVSTLKVQEENFWLLYFLKGPIY